MKEVTEAERGPGRVVAVEGSHIVSKIAWGRKHDSVYRNEQRCMPHSKEQNE
jgi:hypothetical protein